MRRQSARLHRPKACAKFRIALAIAVELFVPLRVGAPAAVADAGLEMLIYAIGHQKRRIFRPAVNALGEADFLNAERLAVRGAGVLLVR